MFLVIGEMSQELISLREVTDEEISRVLESMSKCISATLTFLSLQSRLQGLSKKMLATLRSL